jgi:hypothetical protein
MDFSREQIWNPRKRRVVIALQDDRRRFAAGAQGRNAAASRFINAAVETALAESKPVISVDTKKKELVGDRKNAGQEWRPQGASAHYADGGGSNESRVRLWKRELQKLADEFGITIEVHHFVPGTNKWNRIEHLLFSFITQNWRAKPLVNYRVIVDLIAATTTKTGLKVYCELIAKPTKPNLPK